MSQQDMDLLKDAIAGVLAKTNGFENAGPFEQQQASRVYARVVAPALARVEASRRDWAAEAEKLTEQLQSRQELGDVLLHGYDTVTLALSKRWGQEKTDKFLAQLQEAFPFRQSRGVTVDESGVVELVGEPGVNAPCSCLTPEGAAFVAAQPKWSLPLCAVHPEADRG